MNKKKKGRKFGRTSDQRRALMRSLVVNFIESEKMKTTDAKARELRPVIEKMVTRACDNTLANKRLLISKIGIKATKKLTEKIAPKYLERNGGYTRITKLAPRAGDASKMAVIEFV